MGVDTVLCDGARDAVDRLEVVRQERAARSQYLRGVEDDGSVDHRIAAVLRGHLLPISCQFARDGDGIPRWLHHREVAVDG